MSRPLPEGLDPRVARREVTLEVEAEHQSGMLHEVRVHGFSFRSDEPASLGGSNAHPYPLDYFTAGVAL